MIRLIRVPAIVALLLATSNIFLHGAAKEENGLAAVVNRRVIAKSEVRKRAAMQVHFLLVQEGRSLTQAELERKVKDIERNALQDLIDQQLILSEFAKTGNSIKEQWVKDRIATLIREQFDGDQQKFLAQLKEGGLSYNQFYKMQEESIIVNAMRQQNAKIVAEFVTPFEMQQFWKDNQDLFRSEGFVKLRTITIPKALNGDPSTAAGQGSLVKEIHSKLRNGADFGAMAKTYSVDSGRDAAGVRGTFSKADLNASLAAVAFRITPQQVSDIIDLGQFYTIIYVDARDPGKVSPLSEVEEEVRKRVLQNKRQEQVEKWLRRLRRTASIKVFE